MAKIRHSRFDYSPGCSVDASVNLVYGKWKSIILSHLLDGTMRFGEIGRAVPRVTQRVLTPDLEQDGLISRRVYPELPPKVEYSVAELGRSLQPTLMALKSWGDANMSLFQPTSRRF